MNNTLKIFLLIAAAILFYPTMVMAESSDSGMSRPVTSSYSLGISHKNVLATYLSPLHYTGSDYGISGEWSKAMPFSPQNAIMHFDADMNFSNLWNPAGTARMIGLNAAFRWGMSWRKKLQSGLQVTAGGTVNIDGGAYYLLRNGNNPVEALANISLGIRVSTSKPITLGRLHFLLSDRINLPSLGIFFSPEYGETYYEIYVGNHSGLVHAGWWGNNFRLDNLFSVTLDLGRTAISAGYRFKADNQWACNLNTKIISHSFVIGIFPGGIGLKKKAHKIPSETVYSIY